MKFLALKIENFGPVGEAHVDLEGRGLVLIQGENADDPGVNSNGAGKSTIVEAISWCLYGKTAKGVSGDAVINRKVGKGCMVEVTVEDDNGDVYHIIRGRKHKTFKSKLSVTHTPAGGGIKETDLTKGTDKLTQEVVQSVIGCPYEVFVAAVYSGQEAMPDLPAMTDKQLKLLIEETAGITLLENAYAVARARHAARKAELEAVEDKVERAENACNQADERVSDAKRSRDMWIGERDARIMDMESETRTLLRDAKSLKAKLADLKTEEQIANEREKLRDRIDRHKRDSEELGRLEKIANDLDKDARGLKAVAETMTKDHKKLVAQLDDLNNQIGEPCSACGRAHDEESLASALSAKRSEIEEHKSATREKIEQYKEALSDAQRARESASSFKNDMTDLSAVVELGDALNEQEQHVRDVKSDLKSKLERAKEKTVAIKAEKEKTNPYDSVLEERIEKQKEARKALEKVKEELEPARRAVSVASDVVAVYSPKGVRAHILDTVTPYLNERTAHYLGALSDGVIEAVWQTIKLTSKGEPRENFSIDVTHSGEGSFASLSGGEKRKVRIATALALQDLVATRASKSLDLFIADEIDAALDVAALERLMSVLEEKARERGSVFIISHSDLKDWCQNVMTIKKEGGVSMIEELE